MIPDADSPDAAIFHDEVRGLGSGFSDVLNVVAPLNPLFGYATKYFIYKPAVVFYDAVVFQEYDIRERHRGFLHSFLGLGTATVLTTLYLVPVIVFLDLVWIVGLGVFMAAYLCGAVLHLLEDSCTKSGIQWNFPFQEWQVKGQLTTTAKPEDMTYQRGFLTVLGVGAAGAFFVPITVTGVPVFAFSAAGLVLAILLWVVFARGFAKCAVVPG